MLLKIKKFASKIRLSHLRPAGVGLLVIFASCGVDETNHYDDKRFGRGVSTDDENTNSNDGNIGDANQTLLHQDFQGYFDLNSARAVYFGTDPHNGQVSEGGGVVDGIISTALSFIVKEDSKEKLEMLVTQPSTDLKSVTQTVQTDGGDSLSTFKGEDSQSGVQILDWSAGQTIDSDKATACPKPLVCIKRMVWKPKSGKTFTYCYRDHVTKSPMSIPYSANSNFTREAYVAAIGSGFSSRPFDVTSHPGEVSCDDPEKITYDVNTVRYRLSLGDLAASKNPGFLKRAVHAPLKSDTEVVIQFDLFDPQRNTTYTPKKGPFIDQLTRLNSKIKFYTNTTEHVVVKIERTVTSPFKLGTSSTVQFLRDAYGETVSSGFSALMGQENNIEGVQVNYSFEFCTHLSLIKNPFNHCTGLTAP